MKIYAAEISDGLQEAVSQNNAVSFASVVTDIPVGMRDVASDLANRSNLNTTFATNEGQFDLHYVNTILVTTGWNKNDDVFDRSEIWMAKETPEDKPFNYEHNPADIIGHITGNQVIGEDGEEISNHTPIDQLPEKFHILTSGVLYKHVNSRDAELEERMAGIVNGIVRGEWFVSMEALFTDFDYAIVTPEGKHKVISRSEESAFLTKHLKSYGGDGRYQDYKVGRLIKNITFSGKGLVRRPANPESVFVFDDINSFAAVKAEVISSVGIENAYSSTIEKENDLMSENNESLQLEVAELRKRLKEMDEAAVRARFADLESEVASRDEKIQTMAEAASDWNSSYDELVAIKESLEAKLSEANEANEKISDELQEIQNEIQKASRISTLVDAGLDKSDAETAVDKFVDLNDEQFEEIVKIFDDKTESTQEEDVDDETVEAEEVAEEDSETDPADAVAEDAVLEDAETSDEATLTASDDSEAEEYANMMGALADYLDKTIHR